MTPYYADPLVTLHVSDCIEVMAALEAESVDAVVTDPPYGLEFMGKAWDGANGFRRSLNPADVGRDDVFGRASRRGPEYRAGRLFMEWCEQWGAAALRVTKPGGYLLAFGGTRTHHRLVCGLEDAGWIIRDELDWIYASGFPKGKANLKPAHEPIVLARKPGPLRPLAIDECRIGTTDHLNGGTYSKSPNDGGSENTFEGGPLRNGIGEYVQPSGRWPSNVLLSDPELFDEPNPYVVGSGATSREGRFPGELTGTSMFGLEDHTDPDGERSLGTGGYSRFFIVPKAPRHERMIRGERSTHPTQKPVTLMRHLLRLVTPAGGVALDPFAGSGTTGVAGSIEGIRTILIEREAEYLEQAVDRITDTKMGFGLSEPVA